MGMLNKRPDSNLPLSCIICNKEYVFMKDHDSVYHTKPIEQCGHCEKTFSELTVDGKVKYARSLLRVHIRNVHGPKVPCPTCGELFTQIILDDHYKKVHEEAQDVKCQVPDCGITVKSERYLKQHIWRIHERPKTMCNECGKEVR